MKMICGSIGTADKLERGVYESLTVSDYSLVLVHVYHHLTLLAVTDIAKLLSYLISSYVINYILVV